MTIWSPRPSSLTRSLTMGLRVAKDSAPESSRRPPTSWAPTAPPRWWRCSSRVTRIPAAARRRAEIRPEGPPPMTMAVGAFSLRVKARAFWGAAEELTCAVRCGAWLVWPMVVLLWSACSGVAHCGNGCGGWFGVQMFGADAGGCPASAPSIYRYLSYACAVRSWIYATRSVSTCGSVVGGTPWPRLTTCEGAALPSARTSSTCA